MLKDARVVAGLPTQDLDRGVAWYKDKLGLEPDPEMSNPAGTLFRTAEGTGFMVFPSSGKSDGSFSQLLIDTDDLDGAVAELKSKGVNPIDYDTQTLKTEN